MCLISHSTAGFQGVNGTPGGHTGWPAIAVSQCSKLSSSLREERAGAGRLVLQLERPVPWHSLHCRTPATSSYTACGVEKRRLRSCASWQAPADPPWQRTQQVGHVRQRDDARARRQELRQVAQWAAQLARVELPCAQGAPPRDSHAHPGADVALMARLLLSPGARWGGMGQGRHSRVVSLP